MLTASYQKPSNSSTSYRSFSSQAGSNCTSGLLMCQTSSVTCLQDQERRASNSGYHQTGLIHQSGLWDCFEVLSRQYNPLALLIPYTTQIPKIVQCLWSKRRDWDDTQLPDDILQLWHAWENELHQLCDISLPRCYAHPETDFSACNTKHSRLFSCLRESIWVCDLPLDSGPTS